MAWPICNVTNEYELSMHVLIQKALGRISLIRSHSSRGAQMAWVDLSSCRSCLVGLPRARCNHYVSVSNLSALNLLSQTMATATVNHLVCNGFVRTNSVTVSSVSCSWFPYIPLSHFYRTDSTAIPLILKCSGTAMRPLRLQASLLCFVLTLRQTSIVKKITSGACSHGVGCGPSVGSANAVVVRKGYGEPQEAA